MSSGGPARGFTLIEVLVALIVVAVALAALARTGAVVLDTQYGIESRTLAVWVADNRLAELQLAESLRPGVRTGSERIAGRDLQWRASIEPAPGGQLWRVDIAVSGAGDEPLFTHTGFVTR